MTSKKIFSLARQLTLKWGNDKKTMLPPPGDVYDLEAPTMFPPSAEDLEPDTLREEDLAPDTLQDPKGENFYNTEFPTMIPPPSFTDDELDPYPEGWEDKYMANLSKEVKAMFPSFGRELAVVTSAKRLLSKYSGELAPDTERSPGWKNDSESLLERDLASKPDKFTDQHGEYVTIGDAKAYISEDGGVTFRVGGREISADLVAKDLGVDLEDLKALVVQLHAHGNKFEMEPSPPTDPMPSVVSAANRILSRYKLATIGHDTKYWWHMSRADDRSVTANFHGTRDKALANRILRERDGDTWTLDGPYHSQDELYKKHFPSHYNESGKLKL